MKVASIVGIKVKHTYSVMDNTGQDFVVGISKLTVGAKITQGNSDRLMACQPKADMFVRILPGCNFGVAVVQIRRLDFFVMVKSHCDSVLAVQAHIKSLCKRLVTGDALGN